MLTVRMLYYGVCFFLSSFFFSFLFRDSSFLSNLSTYTMTNFEGAMKHFKVSFPLINAELLASYFSALVAQGILPVPKKTIKGT